MPSSLPKYDVSIIIVSFNTRDILRSCLKSVMRATAAHRGQCETIVVDNASRDNSAQMVVREFPAVRLLRSKVNLGFAAANNLALGMVRGRYVLLLNPDAELSPETISEAVAAMDAAPQVAVMGGLLLDEVGRSQPSARKFPSLLNELLTISGLAARFPRSRLFGRFDRSWADAQQEADIDWAPGAFNIIRRGAITHLGGFDERFFLYYEEVDLCRRIRAAGWRIRYQPQLRVRHIGGASTRAHNDMEISSSGAQLVLWRMRSALLYYRKHHGALSAWALARLEIIWHSLRLFKSRLGGAAAHAKAAESRRLIGLMRQAWRETRGGSISPARPW